MNMRFQSPPVDQLELLAGAQPQKVINYSDPKYNFNERVTRLMRKGCTKEEAERIVRHVIETKEQ